MLSASTTLAAAIVAGERTPAATVNVDFDRNGYSGDDNITPYAGVITITRSLTTDVPDGARMVAGSSAATSTVDLSGDVTDQDKSGSWLWSPANTASPYYGRKRMGAPMQVKCGFKTSAGTELLTRFTGWVSSLDTDGSARSAELAAVDGATRLRTQVILPMMTVLGHPSLDSRAFIDYILTANGINLADCDLEESLNPLTATPYTSEKQDAWTLIQAIAAAECATAFFDETGKFHYWNRQHFTNQTVDYAAKTVTVNGVTNPIPTVTSTRALKTLTTTEATATVNNHVIVSYAPLIVQPADWVWQTAATRGLHSGQTLSILATFSNPVQSVGTTVQVIPLGGDTGSNSGYRACTTPDGSGEPVENLTCTVTAGASQAHINVHNPNSHPVYLVSAAYNSLGHDYPSGTAGTPMLWLRGRPVVANPNYTTTTDGASGASVESMDAASMNPTTGFGEQVYTFDGGGWIQDGDTAQVLADDLVSLLARPIPYMGDVDVVADPRLQLGDRIEVVDTTGMAWDSHAWIVNIADSLDPGAGYSQTLTLRMCAGIGSMVWDHPTFGKWDTYKWDGTY